MANITYKVPYSDSSMEWNESTGQYQLTLQIVKENFDITFRDDGILEKRIKKNSRKVYNYLYANSYSSNRPVITFMLNKTEEGRKYLYDLLMQQMEADLETGFNDLSSQPAINVATGQVIDRQQLAINQISVDTEQIAQNSNSYFGFNLLVQCLFPTTYFLMVM